MTIKYLDDFKNLFNSGILLRKLSIPKDRTFYAFPHQISSKYIFEQSVTTEHLLNGRPAAENSHLLPAEFTG